MSSIPSRSKQPVMVPWSRERLYRERALALAAAGIDDDFPLEPTPDTPSPTIESVDQLVDQLAKESRRRGKRAADRLANRNADVTPGQINDQSLDDFLDEIMSLSKRGRSQTSNDEDSNAGGQDGTEQTGGKKQIRKKKN